MRDGDFLTLLNKANRTMQEENDLQGEIKRRQEAESAQKAAEQPAQPETPVAGTAQPVEQPVTAQEVNTQSSDVQVPENLQTPAPTEQASEVPANPTVNEAQPENVAPQDSQVQPEYSLTQLVSETQEAIAYLEGQEQNEQMQYAVSAYKQAAYLVGLVNK